MARDALLDGGKDRGERAAADYEQGLVVISWWRIPDELTDLAGRLTAQGIGHMLVAGSHGLAGPAHQRHDSRRGLAQDQQHGGSGVPGVVQPRLVQASILEQPLPLGVVGTRVDWLTGRGGEYPVLVVPELAGQLPFLLLLGPVRAQQRDELGWQADRAAASLDLTAPVAARVLWR